jgi:hypothetical protein
VVLLQQVAPLELHCLSHFHAASGRSCSDRA